MNKSTHWMIVYDIRNVKRLAKVAKCVSSYGWRLQKSVFESNASEEIVNAMKSELGKIIEEEDFILFFRICEKDWQKREFFGKYVKEDPMKDKFIIL